MSRIASRSRCEQKMPRRIHGCASLPVTREQLHIMTPFATCVADAHLRDSLCTLPFMDAAFKRGFRAKLDGMILPDVAQRWARTVPRYPPCDDDPKVEACASWATSGECDRNPGFMKSSCPKSCDACPPALYEGKQATALVRDAWEREYKGVYTAQYSKVDFHLFQHS